VLGPFGEDGGDANPGKYVVGNRSPSAVARERVQYLNAQGKLITESLRDYTRINLTKQYDSLDKFLQAWNDADRKAALIEELEARGVLIEALAEEVGLGKDLDPFDLLLHVAYEHAAAHPARTRPRVKKRNVFTQYGPVARKVIDALLDKYADEGITTIESRRSAARATLHQTWQPVELIKSFGGRPQYLQALTTLERELYAPGATDRPDP
jgi:type I restriction enzyme R subunit